MSVSSVIRQGLGSTTSDLVRLGLGSGTPPPAAVGPIITLGLKYTPSDIIRLGIGASAAGAPTAPSSVTGAPTSGTTATIAWTDNSGDETGFDVEIAAVGGGGYVAASGATNPTAANVVSFAATGLTANTEYTARVRAKGASGDSAYATSASWWTDNTGGGGGGLDSTAELAATGGSGTFSATATGQDGAVMLVTGGSGTFSGTAYLIGSASADITGDSGTLSAEAVGRRRSGIRATASGYSAQRRERWENEERIVASSVDLAWLSTVLLMCAEDGVFDA